MFIENQIVKTGDDTFHWFIGVVEDNKDPLKLGRVRVRILGDHTQTKTESRILTEGLPWAIHIISTPSNQMNGIGDSPTALYTGTWVFGFYLDGPNKQMPAIFGAFGGIPRGLPDYNVGFNDPKGIFPMGHTIFEQDTNVLARGFEDRGMDIPESLVDNREKFCVDTECSYEALYGIGYNDKFDEKYVNYYDRGHYDDDDINIDIDEDQKKPELKYDDQCVYVFNNSHPFTAFKFVNRERFIPIAKPFEDPIHREFWHEKLPQYAAEYPYNKVWEGYHEKGSSDIYFYDQTITEYDGSKIEGIHRKIPAGEGSWGLGEEWDSTPGKQRYHRWHPKGNYFEINKDGDEVNKIYGDNFEINLKDKSIYIKGDWNVTVSGNKNELIEGDYNLQIMNDFNVDVRNDINMHCDENHKFHSRGNCELRYDGNNDVIIGGNRTTEILKKDFARSEEAERRANIIIRKGAKSIEDEGFMTYSIKSYNMLLESCIFNEEVYNYKSTIDILDRNVGSLTSKINTNNENIGYHTYTSNSYVGNVAEWEMNCENFRVFYSSELLFEQSGFGSIVPQSPSNIPIIFNELSYYPESDGYYKCIKKYKECMDKAYDACMITITDPRVIDEFGNPKTETRIDWEKYHATIKSCRESYYLCVGANIESTCTVCSPENGVDPWECYGCNDPDCPTDDKKVIAEPCQCDELELPHGVVIIDPWKDCEQEET